VPQFGYATAKIKNSKSDLRDFRSADRIFVIRGDMYLQGDRVSPIDLRRSHKMAGTGLLFGVASLRDVQ